MDGSTCFWVILCGDITSDAVLRSSLDEISSRLETRFPGFGRRCPKSAFRRWLAQAQNRRSFWSALTKSRNDSKDGGYNEFKDMNAVV
jgi:hypothetical protein